MNIGITGPNILSEQIGGAERHTLNILSLLSKEYKFTYFPAPDLYKDFEKNIVNVRAKILQLKQINVNITKYFNEILNNNYSSIEVIKLYCREDISFLFSFDYLYNPISTCNFIMKFSKIKGINFGIVMQAMGDFNLHLVPYLKNTVKLAYNYKVILFRIYNYITRHIILFNLKYGKHPSVILIINNFFADNFNLDNQNTEILSPSNGIFNSLEYSTDDFIVQNNLKIHGKIIFFARLSYSKGIFDILKILKILKNKSDIKLVIIGRFIHNNEKSQFFQMVEHYNLVDKIEYKGFLKDNELYNEIRTSEAMVYPSHSDSFSIAVSQSLILGTPVVAYNIAGLKIYSKFKAVRLVNEFDYKGMANAIEYFLKSSNYQDLFNDTELRQFLNNHTWENVAEQYRKVFTQFGE